jgi:hypothetical protein
MNLLFDITVILAAAAGATIGFLGAALMASHKRRSQYTRGWNAGRDFAARQFHESIQDVAIRTRRLP